MMESCFMFKIRCVVIGPPTIYQTHLNNVIGSLISKIEMNLNFDGDPYIVVKLGWSLPIVPRTNAMINYTHPKSPMSLLCHLCLDINWLPSYLQHYHKLSRANNGS